MITLNESLLTSYNLHFRLHGTIFSIARKTAARMARRRQSLTRRVITNIVFFVKHSVLENDATVAIMLFLYYLIWFIVHLTAQFTLKINKKRSAKLLSFIKSIIRRSESMLLESNKWNSRKERSESGRTIWKRLRVLVFIVYKRFGRSDSRYDIDYRRYTSCISYLVRDVAAFDPICQYNWISGSAVALSPPQEDWTTSNAIY